MLFSRREPMGWRESMRVALWPRRSIGRSSQYVAKRILRLSASPHAVAAGVAAGVAASFTPFMGFHFLISFAIAYAIAGNILAAALGTFVGNPFTFPFIWAGTYATGNFILSGGGAKTPKGGGVQRLRELADFDIFSTGLGGMRKVVAALWEPVLLPMTIGAVPLGILFAVLFYVATRWLIVRFRAARQKRLKSRAEKNAARAAAAAAPAAEVGEDASQDQAAEAAAAGDRIAADEAAGESSPGLGTDAGLVREEAQVRSEAEALVAAQSSHDGAPQEEAPETPPDAALAADAPDSEAKPGEVALPDALPGETRPA
jgi:uncharacterized protein (DUF2062 family)